MRVSSLFAVFVLSLGSLVSAGTGDGVWIIDDGNYSWSNTGGWRRGTLPDGGVATFQSCPNTMNVDSGSVELGGLLRTGNRTMSFTNGENGLAFVADPSFVINWASSLTLKGPLVGTGSNRLELGGACATRFENLASNFGEVAVVDSAVILPAKAGTVLSAGNVTLNEGEIRIVPDLAAGETASLAMCDGAGSRFTCGPGFGRLTLNHGAGDGVTLTLPSLAVSNGALAVSSATSLSALGAADRLLFADPPAVENGMVSPALALYDAASEKTGFYKGSFFATYDATRGLVPAADPVAWEASADQSAAIVRLAGDATVSAAKSVYALYWDAANDRTLTLDADLRVLSGGIIANLAADAAVSGMRIAGAGALDFGDRPGVFRGSSLASDKTKAVKISLAAPIRGSKGVLFSGSPEVLNGNYVGNYEYTLTQPAGWTGPTVVANGAKIVIPDALGAQAFPSGGEVFVIGGDHRNGASIRLTKSTAFDQNFVIAGAGSSSHGSGNTGPIYLGGNNVTITFNGTTRFQDSVFFSHDNNVYVLKFVGRVSGAGNIVMNYGVLEFAGPNAYRGAISAANASSTLVVSGDGTLGSATVSVTKGALKLSNLNGQTLGNDITCTGTMTIDGGHVVLTGRVKAAKTIIQNGAVVEIGDDVDLGQVTFLNGSKVMAAPGATRARVEIGGDGAADVALLTGLSGASDVPFVKSGTNTVTLGRGCALGGELTVGAGTLKLAPGLLASASFWLDASCAETVVTNGLGGATAWRSANGNGRVFSYATEGGVGVPGTYPGPKMNGRDTMHFDHTGASMTWFVSDTSVDIRSIYVCMKPYFYDSATPTTLTPWGWYGQGNPEYGLRWATYSTWHDLGFTTSKKRVNGGKTSVPSTADGKPLLIGQFNADDSTAPKSMRPSIGGYQTWGRVQNAYNGEIGEVVAFDHEIAAEEKLALEQYLSVKWGVGDAAGLWPEADTSCLFGGPVLADTAALTLVDGAVFDLNGANQTIASLAGAGLITNSSATAATLTVTGACDFSGVIAANVKLVAAGAVKGEVNGALVANGGTVTLADAAYAPPEAGRLWWFDAANVTEVSGSASSAGSIRTNGYGRVTRWYAQGDAETWFESYDLSSGSSKYAQYVEAAEGVPAGLYMNAQVGLCCNKANSPHTIAVVYAFDETFDGASYFFCGHGFGDSSMRVYASQKGVLDFEFNFRKAASFSNYGDHVYVNGARIEIDGSANVTLPLGGLCRYIGTRDPSHTDANWVNRKFCFGSSCWSKGVKGTKICEAVCYDRLLTDDECRALDTYLANRWGGRAAPRAKVGSGAALGATAGGTLDVTAAAPVAAAKLVSSAGGGRIVGDLAVGGFEYDAENAASAAPLVVAGRLAIADGARFSAANTTNLTRRTWPLLTADSATGSFTPGELGARRWTLHAGAAEWGLTPRGLVMLVR